QHPQTHLAKVGPFLLVVAPLGELGGGVGIDEREEIGAVVGQGAQRELELVDEPLGELSFDRPDVGFLQEIQMIPEGLAGEVAGVRRVSAVVRYQSAKRSLLTGRTARLMAASSRYFPTESPWWRLGRWRSRSSTSPIWWARS